MNFANYMRRVRGVLGPNGNSNVAELMKEVDLTKLKNSQLATLDAYLLDPANIYLGKDDPNRALCEIWSAEVGKEVAVRMGLDTTVWFAKRLLPG